MAATCNSTSIHASKGLYIHRAPCHECFAFVLGCSTTILTGFSSPSLGLDAPRGRAPIQVKPARIPTICPRLLFTLATSVAHTIARPCTVFASTFFSLHPPCTTLYLVHVDSPYLQRSEATRRRNRVASITTTVAVDGCLIQPKLMAGRGCNTRHLHHLRRARTA